jgi:hypothetical protein
MPSCMTADDIEHLLQEIPVHPPTVLVVPVRTVHEAVAAGDLPPLEVDAAKLSQCLLAERTHSAGSRS